MLYKRMSIRIVDSLSEDLREIAQKRGLSLNALISEMAWDFVDEWKSKYKVGQSEQTPLSSNPSGIG